MFTAETAYALFLRFFAQIATMAVPILSHFSCPHCYEKNPAFGEQKCISCGVRMFSDKEQQVRTTYLYPKAELLQKKMWELESHPRSLGLFKEIQPILFDLARLSQQFDWLQGYVGKVEEFLLPYQQALDRFKRQLLVHLFVFFILLLAPILAFWLGADPMMSSLLFLPVIGWGYLGLWQYTKPLRSTPQSSDSQRKGTEEMSNNE